MAMIGAITLTLRRRENVRKQSISIQNDRTREETIQVVKVSNRIGVRKL